MMKGKGFLWRLQLQIGIRKLSPITSHSQLLGLELHEELALSGLRGQGHCVLFGGVSTYMPE